MKPEEIPQELIDILDTNAQRKHSRTGSVIKTLAEILTTYDRIRMTYPGPLWQKHVREHDPEDGCYGCCDDCNYDAHRCRGCGQPIGHNQAMCTDCRKEIVDGD